MTQSIEKNKKIKAVALATQSARIVGSSSFFIGYLGFFAKSYNTAAGTAITGFGAYILMPLIGLTNMLDAGLSWVHTWLDRRKNGEMRKRNIADSAVASISALGFGVAIVGMLAAGMTFSLASPILFMAFIGAKVLYDLGAAIYYKRKSASIETTTGKVALDNKNNQRKDKYSDRANNRVVSAALGLVALTAVTLVFLCGIYPAAILGMIITTAFVTLSVIAIAQTIKSFKDHQEDMIALSSMNRVGEESAHRNIHQVICSSEDKQNEVIDPLNIEMQNMAYALDSSDLNQPNHSSEVSLSTMNMKL